MFRRTLAVVGVLAGLMVGCPDPKPTPADPDPGDWVDTGEFAQCTVSATPGSDCGELSSYDLSACDRSSFGAFDPAGSYVVHQRYLDRGETKFRLTALHIDPSGATTEYVDGQPGDGADGRLNRRQFDGTTFFLGHRGGQLPSGAPGMRSFAGCRAVSADKLVGCFAFCSNGVVTRSGTFEALNVRRAAGEDEAKNIALLGEHAATAPGEGFGTPVDVYVTKGHAYVVSVDTQFGNGGLTVFDVSNPASPTITEQISSVRSNGRGGYWNGVWAKGDALYVASGYEGVITFDLADPAHPVRGPVQVTEAINVHTVFVRDDHLYAQQPANLGGSIIIYDVSNPLAPSLVTRYVVPDAVSDPTAYPHDAFVYQGRMYVNWWGAGYRILDVSNPSDPKELGAYRYAQSTSHANAVGTYGDRLIAFEGGEDWGAHLRVLDVTDPANPVKIGEYAKRPEISIHNMVLDEAKKHLYIAYYQEGVRVLDVADPANPVELAYFNTYRPNDPDRGASFFDGAIGIRVPGDGRIYVIDAVRGLLVLSQP